MRRRSKENNKKSGKTKQLLLSNANTEVTKADERQSNKERRFTVKSTTSTVHSLGISKIIEIMTSNAISRRRRISETK